MKIITLGTSHGATEKGRSCSGTLIETGGAYYLFDCGGNVEGKMTDLELPIGDLRAVFVSHMHEDHAGTLSAIAKRFTVYMKDGFIRMFLPEQKGIDGFKVWLDALHLPPMEGTVEFSLTAEGKVYEDENVTVWAIRTHHIENGVFPSYAYVVRTADKKILYTGDLAYDFHDYPQIVFEEDFDVIVSELVHFDLDKNLDTIMKSRTKKLIFTHLSLKKAPIIEQKKGEFPFEVCIAEDNMEFDV